ncbi:MAG: nucleotide sugar dehydrogenase [Saprospiraceae bacterium]|nr:nucleotide sugar dehydrogenase [Saprospiraceae bacterium]
MTTKTIIETLCVGPEQQLIEVLRQLDEAVQEGLPGGIALVTNKAGQLIGTITDGDIRRASLDKRSFEFTAAELMNPDPIFFTNDYSFRRILEELPQELERRGRKSKKFLSKVILVDAEKRPSRIIEYHQLWEQRVASHRHIVVVGLGYVGFTLATVLADQGFQTTGFDVDKRKVDAIDRAETYIHERGLEEIFLRQAGKNLKATTNIPETGDVYIISVGTPVGKPSGDKMPAPNLSALEAAARSVGSVLRSGNLVILRSTVPIGATREIVLPILEQESGLIGGLDFHLSFAPERTAEGKAVKELRELPQIIGGLNEESVEATAALFRDLTPTIVRVNSLEQAEIAKLLNNTFRDLVFSYANEMAQLASHYNVDIVETIKAANQGYPRNRIPLPSPGVGGACLTKDPYILASVAQKFSPAKTLFQQGRQINESMHDFVVDRVLAVLKKAGKSPENCKILICGLAFKGEPETGDVRNSSAVEVAKLFEQAGCKVVGHDPVARKAEILEEGVQPVDYPAAAEGADAILFLNNHRFYEGIDIPELLGKLNSPAILFDGWKLFNTDDVLNAGPCVYMGLSFVASSLEDTIL